MTKKKLFHRTEDTVLQEKGKEKLVRRDYMSGDYIMRQEFLIQTPGERKGVVNCH